MAGWCPNCREPRWDGMLRCPVCDELQTDPPQVLTDPTIDLRAPAPVPDEPMSESPAPPVPPDRGDRPVVLPDHRALDTAPHLRPPTPAARSLRVLAGLADWLVVSTVVYLPVFVVMRTVRPDGTSTLSDGGRWAVTLAPFLYAFLFVGARGATPGKILFRLQVRDGRDHPCGWRSAGVRAVAPAAISIVGTALPTSPIFESDAGGWIGVAWLAAIYVPLLVDDQRRGLHDRLAGTVVTMRRTSPRPPPSWAAWSRTATDDPLE